MGTISRGQRNEWTWRLLSAVLLAGVIYSTGLHLTWGPQSVLDARWYSADTVIQPEHDDVLRSRYPDMGRHDVAIAELGAWRLTDFSHDAGLYLAQTRDPSAAVAPWSYRIGVPLLAQTAAGMFGWALESGFLLVNVLALIAAGLVVQWHLERDHRVGRAFGLVGGLLTVTVLQAAATVAFPMVDPATVLVGALLLVALYRRNWLAAGLVGAVGVLVKEVAVVATPLILVGLILEGRPTAGQIKDGLLASALPVGAFVGLRMAMGGGAFEASYGADLRTSLPMQYLERVVDNPVGLALAILFAFGPLWLGLFALRDDDRLRTFTLAISGLMVAATVALSAGVGRVLGIVAPFLVVGMVRVLSSIAQHNAPSPSFSRDAVEAQLGAYSKR